MKEEGKKKKGMKGRKATVICRKDYESLLFRLVNTWRSHLEDVFISDRDRYDIQRQCLVCFILSFLAFELHSAQGLILTSCLCITSGSVQGNLHGAEYQTGSDARMLRVVLLLQPRHSRQLGIFLISLGKVIESTSIFKNQFMYNEMSSIASLYLNNFIFSVETKRFIFI